MWESADERLAILELLVRGTLKKRRAQSAAFDALAELPWTRATGRRDQIGLVEERRHELAGLIDRVWPTWGDALAELTALGAPPTPDGWRTLEDSRRAQGLPTLPERINRRTAAAHAAPHSKAALTARRRAALGDAEPTHDGTVRLRTPAGLRVRTPRGSVDLTAVDQVLGEVAIPERAFRDGLVFEGAVRAVLLVENLGAWRDLPAPEGFLIAHVPGWDTATVGYLLDRFGHVPLVHFGDLDPNGVRIFMHLRDRRPDLIWFVPSFWIEVVDACGQRGAWPEDIDISSAPPLVSQLASRALWLEQERIVLDARLRTELESIVSTSVPVSSDAPPPCPDCGSTQREPKSATTWMCPDCAGEFADDVARRGRTRAEWVELIRTMLPQPVRMNEEGELCGGDPVTVIVAVHGDAIAIHEAKIEWPSPVQPRVVRGPEGARLPRTAAAVRVAEGIAAARAARLARYSWCPRCRKTVEPEHTLSGEGGRCHGCASACLGIVY